MVAMNSPKTYTNRVMTSIKGLAPGVTFEPGDSFYWSPRTQTVTYNESSLSEPGGIWSLLHETSHALLDHTVYNTDFELLSLEVAAWEHAKQLGPNLETTIDENYVQDCLDTYRDWLHRRSTCPTCGSVGLQHSTTDYRCHNCNSIWHVTEARFCRPYRRKVATKEKSPDSVKNQTTFQ